MAGPFFPEAKFSYRSIKYIKYGAKQYGAVKFEGLPYNEPTIRFEFRLRYDDPTPFFGSPTPSERISSWLFVFEVQIQK
jgi:hypothetical protein